jgi:type II secretory pathway component PulC
MVVVACCVLAVALLWPSERIPTQADVAPAQAQISPPVIQPYTTYASMIGSREIFSVEQVAKADSPPPIDINKIKERLSILGIISSDGALQAVIEEKTTQKTYYLRIQESFDDITVIDINEAAGKVTFNYQGIDFTIYL